MCKESAAPRFSALTATPSREFISPAVSIVIVNWNTAAYLRTCLASLRSASGPIEREVIVIDNASTDDSANMVRHEFPEVHLIANDSNRGFAAANNQGLRIARGRYCLLLNPDTIVLDGCIAKSAEFMDAHPDVAVMGCQVLENESTIQPTCFRFPSPFLLFWRMTGVPRMFPRSAWLNPEALGGWDRKAEREVDVVSGMYFMVRRAAMEAVGLFDEAYFVYGEEVDWCYRFRRAGWRCVFAPVGQIVHCEGGGKSTAQIGVRMYVQQQKSTMIFYRKNLGIGSWLAAKSVYILLMLFRCVTWSMIHFVTRNLQANHRAACAAAALKFHLLGVEPCR